MHYLERTSASSWPRYVDRPRQPLSHVQAKLSASQKAAKQLAARNAAILRRTHLISLLLHAIFILIRLVLFRASCTRATYILYAAFSAPALGIEAWFERSGRPRQGGRAGDDLEAKGLTEYMFDVLYWAWGTLAAAMLFGDYAWWLWAAVPVYSVYLLVTTFGSVRKGLAGLGGQGGQGSEGAEGATSSRQKKMEKRGGQKIQYR